MRGLWTKVAVIAAVLAGPASAGEAGDILRSNLEAGTIHAGGNAVAKLMRETGETPEGHFALGMLEFVRGIEELGQALYLHGLAAPEAGPIAPDLTIPVPANPDPEALDYDGVRLILLRLQRQMDEAAERLLMAGRAEGEGADFVVPLDPTRIRIDLDGDGAGDASEAIAAIIARAFGEDASVFEDAPAEPSVTTPRPQVRPGDEGARSRGGQRPPPPAAEPAPQVTIGFDRADAIWLAGYANIVAAQADFLLAHDFSELVAASFHRLFPRAGFPMQGVPDSGLGIIDPQSDAAIADAIAAIHTLDWPVVEPERLRRVRERGLSVTALSRENWQAILAETDDFFELVPSPRQSSLPEGEGLVVTKAVVAAWMETLDRVDDILEGRLLLPHWRFTKGFDLKAYFETASHTDIVLLVTGQGALPYLADGPIADAESFRMLNAVMGEDWPGFALWFN